MAAHLGITKPTLYYYVPSKSDLVHMCAMRGWEQAMDAVKKALQQPDAAQALQAALTAYGQVLASDFGWCMVRVEEYALPAALQKTLQQQRKTLEALLGAVVPDTVAVPMLLRSLEGAVLALPKRMWISLIDVLLQGIQPQTSAANYVLAATRRPDPLAVTVSVQEAAPAAEIAALVPIATDTRLPEPAISLEKQSIDADLPTHQKPTEVAIKKVAKKRSKPAKVLEQISLF